MRRGKRQEREKGREGRKGLPLTGLYHKSHPEYGNSSV
jgi:hypothetical protein